MYLHKHTHCNRHIPAKNVVTICVSVITANKCILHIRDYYNPFRKKWGAYKVLRREPRCRPGWVKHGPICVKTLRSITHIYGYTYEHKTHSCTCTSKVCQLILTVRLDKLGTLFLTWPHWWNVHFSPIKQTGLPNGQCHAAQWDSHACTGPEPPGKDTYKLWLHHECVK